MGRLDGKVAFITGAARGQGRAHAIRLAQEGADLILCDVCGPVGSSTITAATPDDLTATVEQVEALGRRVVAAEVDVRDADAVRALVDKGVADLGRVDVVVANAGILTWARTHEMTSDQWNDVVDVNLTGTFHTVQAALPHMLEQGTGGSIIVISSAAGLKGQPFTLSYTASKHGLVGLTNALAIEYGDFGIRANSIHPCGVATHMGEAHGLMELITERAETVGPTFMNTLPVAFAEPEDISDAVAFLASDESKYVTGLQMKVDAGNVGR